MTISRRALIQAGAVAALLPRSPFAQELKPGKPYAGTTLSVLTVVAPQFKAHEAMLPEFEQLTGIKVTYDYVPFANTRDKLTAELVAKSGSYDVVSVMDVWGPSLVGLIQPINDRVKAKKIDMEERYPSAHLRASKSGANILGLPIRGHVQLLFYRRDIFDQLGLKVPSTWQQVVESSKVIQAKTDLAGIAMYYKKNAGQNLMIWYNFLWGKGADILDAQGKPAFNAPAGVEATQDYLDMMLKHKVTPAGSVAFDENDATISVAQGRSAMIPVWWWRLQQLRGKDAKITGDQVGFAPLPSYPGASSTTYTNTWFYGLNRFSKKHDAGMEYLAWLTQPKIERSLLVDPSKNEIVCMQRANLIDGEVNKVSNGLHRFGALGLQGARGVPLIPEWPQISDILETTMSELASGKAQVKPTLDDAAGRVRKLMRRA